MNFILQPWQLLFAALCGWVNQRQQEMIAFQNTQIESLLQKLGQKRLLLTDDQRRLLAVKGYAPGAQGAHGADHDRHARHDSALAPRIAGSEVGSQRQTQVRRPAADSPSYR